MYFVELDNDTARLIRAIPYAHIAQRVEVLWGTVECDKYINALLIADRARSGFNNEIAQQLFALLGKNDRAMRSSREPKSQTVKAKDWANKTAPWRIIKSRESKVVSESGIS